MTSSGRFGFTAKQAEWVKHQIDKDMAAIEDRARRMRERVKDISTTTAPVELHLEELRSVAEELKSVVDRRTL